MEKILPYSSGMSNGFFVVGDGVIAVDTGCREGKEAFIEQCQACGIQAKEIKLLVVTHGHVDHFVNLPAMKALTGASILCHKEAAPFLERGLFPDVVGRTPLGREILQQQELEGPPIDHVPKIKPDILIDDVFDLRPWGVDGTLIPTPGHSRGCISLVLSNGEAIVGDLYAEPAGSGKPGPAFFCYPGAPWGEVLDSLDRLLQMGVHTFYSGHGGPFSREVVEQTMAAERQS